MPVFEIIQESGEKIIIEETCFVIALYRAFPNDELLDSSVISITKIKQ